MPFPMLKDKPVFSIEGRWFLPNDTETTDSLCGKIAAFHAKNAQCSWGDEKTRQMEAQKAGSALASGRLVRYHSQQLRHE